VQRNFVDIVRELQICLKLAANKRNAEEAERAKNEFTPSTSINSRGVYWNEMFKILRDELVYLPVKMNGKLKLCK